MTIATLPAVARIKEARLRVMAPTVDVTRPLTLKTPFAAAMRERWHGELLFATLSRLQTQELTAWLESLDGRTTPFFVPLRAGKFSQVCDANVALGGAVVPGADALPLLVGQAPLLRGTRIALGDPEAREYQVFDVLETVQPTSGAPTIFTDETDFEDGEPFLDEEYGDPQLVRVAPRVRFAFADTAPLVAGTVNAKFTLAADELETAVRLSHGILSIEVVESLNA